MEKLVKYKNQKNGEHLPEMIVPIIIIAFLFVSIFKIFIYDKTEIQEQNYKFINDLETILSYDNYLLSDKRKISNENLNIFKITINDFEFINSDEIKNSNKNIKENLLKITNDKIENKKEVLDNVIVNYKEKIFFLKNSDVLIEKNKSLLRSLKCLKTLDNKTITIKKYTEFITELKEYFDLVEVYKSNFK